jgi:hypothetical protein
MADLDFDGDLEIAVPTTSGTVYLMHHDLTDYPATPPFSWPFTVASASHVNSIAFADNLGVDSPELAFSALRAEVYLMVSNGEVQPAYPMYTEPGWWLFGSPIVDQVNVSASSVIIGSRDFHGYAWRNTGGITPGWPKDLGGQCQVSPASGDIDLDGSNEIVFVTLSNLVVVDVNYPPADFWRDVWPMYAHDPMRTGCLSGPVEVTAADPAEGPSRLLISTLAPNPSRGAVHLEYSLPTRAVVELDVFDSRGRRVRTLLREEQVRGDHRERWDGLDTHGQAVAAGVYFLRLQVAGPGIAERALRKVTMLR